MRYRSVFQFVVAAALAGFSVLSCDKISGDGKRTSKSEIKDFLLGYSTDADLLKDIMGGEGTGAVGTDVLTNLITKEAFDELERQTKKMDSSAKSNRLEYTDKLFGLKLQTSPKNNIVVNGVIALSSDTTVVKVLGASENGLALRFLKVGSAELTVTVTGAMNTLTHVYPLRIVDAIELTFSHKVPRIYMKTDRLPQGMSMYLMVEKDSVRVAGVCEYYDLKKYGSRALYARDTIVYPMRTWLVLLARGGNVTLRNLNDAYNEFDSMGIEGTRIERKEITVDGKTSVQYDTVACVYPWEVEEVLMDFYAVSSNSYVEFLCSLKGEENFKVRLNDFLTPAQRDSIMKEVDEAKSRFGYSDDMSDSEKEAAIDKINLYLNKD